MKKTVDFSIVFPAMNQADHIEKVIRSYHEALTKNHFSFELVAVINGSRDRSFSICQQLTKELPKLTVFELKKDGYGRAILYGLDKARGRYLCYINCARVHADELILALKYFFVNPQAIIHAVRKKRDVFYRALSSKIYNFFCRLFFQINSSDINGSPKIFSRENYQKLYLTFPNSMIDLEFVEKVKKKGLPLIEIPIFKNTRHGGKSTTNSATIFRLLKEMTHYWWLSRLKSA